MNELYELIESAKIVGDAESKVELCRYLIKCLNKGTLTDENVRTIRSECHLTSAYYLYAEMETEKEKNNECRE